MRVCVLGLWHLGTVTAACLVSGGHQVTGLDFDSETVSQLQAGQPPLFEPGLEGLIKEGRDQGRLSFTDSTAEALEGANIVWVAYDTPVDDEDRADVSFVFERVVKIFPFLEAGTLVLISSQLPVGTTRRLEEAYFLAFPDKPATFGYIPENLRLGKAIQVFTRPDRVVAGIRSAKDQEKVALLLKPFTERIEWMTVESAEMTKHALNAFLATSVTFINEIAVLCERVGADAKEVERGLKSETRIGPGAYLSPGGAFAGGTLARDIAFLTQLGKTHNLILPLIPSVQVSNDHHKTWPRLKLQEVFGSLTGRNIAVWGLTYKPNTSTLRRSSAIELCRWLYEQGAQVRAHDPAVSALPPKLANLCTLYETPQATINGAEAIILATEWPVYQAVTLGVDFIPSHTPTVIIDANRFLEKTLGRDSRFRYVTVGKPTTQILDAG